MKIVVLALCFGVMVLGSSSLRAATVTWDGSGDMNWEQPDATSWGVATYNSGDICQFQGAGTGTVTVVTNVTPASVRFNGGSGVYTITGGTISGGSDLQKTVAGLDVTLSNTNTYSGMTSLLSTKGLTFRGKEAVSSNTTFRIHSNGGSGGIKLLMDDAGTVNLGNEIELYQTDTIGYQTCLFEIYVGANAAPATGNTIALGLIDFAYTGGKPHGSKLIQSTGDSDYRLQVGDADLSVIITYTSDRGPQGFYPTTAPVTVTGTVKQINGNAGNTIANQLWLGGPLATATNYITGLIKDADDYPANTNAQPLLVRVNDVSNDAYDDTIWVFSNTNSYSGGTRIGGDAPLYANAPNALGVGDVTVSSATASLIVNSANAMSRSAALYLPNNTTETLILNANMSVAALFLGGEPQADGHYTSSEAWLGGSGTLTVGAGLGGGGSLLLVR